MRALVLRKIADAVSTPLVAAGGEVLGGTAPYLTR
jgi:hypothetical protein